MENWSFDTENGSGILAVEGDMTISRVSDLKSRLVEAFECAEQVTVDLSATTAFDVAGLQLLCACHRFSTSRGKKMCLKLGENERLFDFLEEVGFAQDFFCNHGNAGECLWSSVN